MQKTKKEKLFDDGIIEVVLTIPIRTKNQKKIFLKYFKDYPGQIKHIDLVQVLR